jgi:hypothetical protein
MKQECSRPKLRLAPAAPAHVVFLKGGLVIVLTLTALLQAVLADAPQEVVGEWSAEQNFLKARFIARHEFVGADSEFVVYLELYNTCPRVGTVMRKVSFDPATNITYRVTGEDGREVEPERAVFRDTIRITAYDLAIPPDGHLRFPITLPGGGAVPDKTKLDISPRRGIWYFDINSQGPHELSGVLRVPRVWRSGPEVWWGELKIPPVRLKGPPRKQR